MRDESIPSRRSKCSVLPRRPRSNRPVMDPHGGEALPDNVPIDAIAISKQILRCVLPGEGFGNLPRNPLGGRMGGDRRRDDATAMMVQDHEPIEEAKVDRRHDEQIHRGDADGVVAKETP